MNSTAYSNCPIVWPFTSPCMFYGSCIDGVCVCEKGWTGFYNDNQAFENNCFYPSYDNYIAWIVWSILLIQSAVLCSISLKKIIKHIAGASVAMQDDSNGSGQNSTMENSKTTQRLINKLLSNLESTQFTPLQLHVRCFLAGISVFVYTIGFLNKHILMG